MILRARDGIKGEVWDLDTGKKIPNVIWLDTELGTFEAYRSDADGNIVTDAEGCRLIYWAKGRLRFVAEESSQAWTPKMPPQIHPELPKMRRPKKRRTQKLSAILFDQPCEECSRPAEYQVSDEIELPPQFARGRWWERARTVQVWYYCAYHYKAPALLDHKGEEIKRFEDAGGVRPQWTS